MSHKDANEGKETPKNSKSVGEKFGKVVGGVLVGGIVWFILAAVGGFVGLDAIASIPGLLLCLALGAGAFLNESD